MSGSTDGGGGKGVADLLAEVLKAFGKDGLGQLVPTRVVQGVPAEGAFCAYEALDALAAAIAGRVAACIDRRKPTRPVPVLLQPGEDMAELLEYRSLLARLGTLATTLEDATTRAGDALAGGSGPTIDWDRLDLHKRILAITPGAVALAGQAAGAAIALIGTFARTTTSEQHGNVAIADADLLAAVAKALPTDKAEALRPSALALRAAEWAGEDGRLLKRLDALDAQARALRDALAEVDARLAPKPAAAATDPAAPPADDLVAQLAAIVGDGAPPPGNGGAAARLRAAKTNGEAALRNFDAAWAALPAALPRLVRADAMERVLRAGGLFLGLRVLVASGATLRRESGILWWREVEESALGSVLGSFVLLDAEGEALDAARLPETVRKPLDPGE